MAPKGVDSGGPIPRGMIREPKNGMPAGKRYGAEEGPISAHSPHYWKTGPESGDMAQRSRNMNHASSQASHQEKAVGMTGTGPGKGKNAFGGPPGEGFSVPSGRTGGTHATKGGAAQTKGVGRKGGKQDAYDGY